jgi:hypothetical protein
MRSLKPLALVAVVAMAACALLAPIADAGASPAASTVKASKKKSSCKKSKRKGTPKRGASLSSADTAARKRKAKKCKKAKKVLLRRTYRGKTSQGEPIELKTNNLRKKVDTLGFFVKHVCKTPFAGPQTISEEFNMLFSTRLRGTAFAAEVPSFDAEFQYVASVTGKAGATAASGRASVTAGGFGDSACAAATFTFSIPKVREVRR